MSNDELQVLIRNRVVTFNMYDGTMKQVRVKKLLGADNLTAKTLTYTDLQVFRQGIKSIVIMNDDEMPKISL